MFELLLRDTFVNDTKTSGTEFLLELISIIDPDILRKCELSTWVYECDICYQVSILLEHGKESIVQVPQWTAGKSTNLLDKRRAKGSAGRGVVGWGQEGTSVSGERTIDCSMCGCRRTSAGHCAAQPPSPSLHTRTMNTPTLRSWMRG